MLVAREFLTIHYYDLTMSILVVGKVLAEKKLRMQIKEHKLAKKCIHQKLA